MSLKCAFEMMDENVYSRGRSMVFWILVMCIAFGESYILRKSSFEIENTQSTVVGTLPDYTTREQPIGIRPDVKSNEAILKQCELFPTPRLRKLCENIAENPIIVEMKGHARGVLSNIPWNGHVKKNDPSFSKNGITCPDYSKEIPFAPTHLRSLSPWKRVTEYDKLRFPQWIWVAKCMCVGCIDQVTGKENTNFSSQEITVKVRFLRMNATSSTFKQCTDQTCYPSDEDVTVGCHCAIPFS